MEKKFNILKSEPYAVANSASFLLRNRFAEAKHPCFFVEFDKKVFDPKKCWSPHYDAYENQIFKVDHYSDEDPSMGHLWLVCVTNPEIKVAGYVHTNDLVAAQINLENTKKFKV